MNSEAFSFSFLNSLTKLASDDLFVYTAIPNKSWRSVRKHGLLSAEGVVKNKRLLALARPQESDRQALVDRVSSNVNDPIVKGPSVFFGKPDMSKIGPNHYIRKWNTQPAQINLSALLRDDSSTKIHGFELTPHHESKKPMDKERFLTVDDVRRYTKMSPKELWAHNNDVSNSYYAADVPHAAIITKDGKIPAKYVKRLSTWQ